MTQKHVALLIITPNEFVESLKPLKEHKDRTDLPTLIVTLEMIYSNFPGLDETEKVIT